MRFELDKSVLVQKNIGVHAIITRLRDRYSDLYLVYTTERAEKVVIRAYVRASGLDHFSIQTTDAETKLARRKGVRKSRDMRVRIHDVYETILDTIIRGVEGVWTARVERMMRTRINDEGAVVDDAVRFGIRTGGTNLVRASRVPGVRAEMVQTDAVQEIASVLGIEAARHRIIAEMRELVDKCNVRHYMVYADEMTRTGRVTSIERGGLAQREVNNISLRAGMASPVQVFTEAAINTRRDVLAGVSGPLVAGTVPRVGTMYNSFIMDTDVIKRYTRTGRDAVSDL
jgi:DNA-directed RNA polymerase II subunit RPB1